MLQHRLRAITADKVHRWINKSFLLQTKSYFSQIIFDRRFNIFFKFFFQKALVTPRSDELLKRVKLRVSNLPERSPTSVNNVGFFVFFKNICLQIWLFEKVWLIMQQRLSGSLRRIGFCRFSLCSQICVFDKTDVSFSAPFCGTVAAVSLRNRLTAQSEHGGSSKSNHLTNLWPCRGETDVFCVRFVFCFVFFSFLINGTERTKDWDL